MVMHLDVDEFGGLDFDEFVEAWFLVPEGVKGVLMKQRDPPPTGADGNEAGADTGDKGVKLKREVSNPRLKREVSSPRSGAGAEETRRNSSKPKRVLSYRVEESKKHPEKDRPPTKARCTVLWSAMDRLYIPPGSPPRITWDLSMCLLIMWYAAVTPLRVGFDLFVIEGEKEMETVRLPAVGLRARHQSFACAFVVLVYRFRCYTPSLDVATQPSTTAATSAATTVAARCCSGVYMSLRSGHYPQHVHRLFRRRRRDCGDAAAHSQRVLPRVVLDRPRCQFPVR